MQWKKHGLLFEPDKQQLPGNCIGFAQSPQTLVMSDRIRVYFSTRERDEENKYISHIAYVDYSFDFEQLGPVSQHEVISLGELGAFDEHGIFPIHIFKWENRILAYTTGWNRKVSVPADASIGFAESFDGGRSFKKMGKGPILGAILHEPFLVGDAFVYQHEDQLIMWYIFGTEWITPSDGQSPERVYKITQATSKDAINWERTGEAVIPDRLNASECQALPTVIERNGTFHMYFCYREAIGFRENSSSTYKIGYAYSEDLIKWHRSDEESGLLITGNEWDSDMQCYPHVFKVENKTYMLYNGNEFGRHGFGLAELQ